LKKHLREQVITMSRDKNTGVMELSALVPQDPELAARFVNALTDSLNSFVEMFNGSKARQRLSYVQRRIDEVTGSLHELEDDYTRFKEENRAYRSSPRLSQIAAEKEREIQALTAVWVELIKQLELAKLEDNKERFSIEILDRAQPPLRKAKPQRASMAIVGAILGALAWSLFILGRAVQRGAP